MAVTTDDDHRVYAAGNDVRQYNRTGYLYAFEECGKLLRRTRIGTLQINFACGVAVDAAGDVFVAFFGGGNRGRFVEFVGGGSTPTYLGAVIGGGSGSTGSGTGGLIIDKNGTLIATDTFNTIYTIPPPYSTANVLATGLSFPWTLSLNKPETLLYSANAGSGTVTAFKYPSGKRVKTLNTFPAIGVAAGPDATF